MPRLDAPSPADATTYGPVEPTSPQRAALAFVRLAGEGTLVALLVIAPWLLAGAEALFELVLTSGLTLVMALWAIHVGLARRMTLQFDWLSGPLLALVVLTGLQCVPLPEAVVGLLSPDRLAWHRELVPETLERLPGEAESLPRPGWLTLSFAPEASYRLALQLTTLLLLALVVRNWLAGREFLDRLAWAMTANGVLLALVSIGTAFGGSSNVVLGLVTDSGVGAYGPFVCRNHYPDYAAVAMGLTAGLLLRPQEKSPNGVPGPWLTPTRLSLLLALGLMIVAVPLSQSRGGTLSVAAATALVWLLGRWPGAGTETPAGRSPARYFLAGAVAVGLGLFLWMSTGAIEQRFGSLGGEAGTSGRLPLWRSTAPLAFDYWLTGTGGGTFVTVEPTVRNAETSPLFIFEYAHNDYLEAAVEGGLPRLAVTLLLVVGVIVAVTRGFLARRHRSVGPRLAGLLFELLTVVLHAASDFALHMPAVALAAVTAAAVALAAATEARFVPQRVKVRRSRDGTRREQSATPSPEAPSRRGLTGLPAQVVSCGLVVLAGAAAHNVGTVARAERVQGRADRHPAGSAERAALLSEAAMIRPGDARTQFDAGQAHLDHAVASLPAGAMAFTPESVAGPVARAAGHFRLARAADPLLARTHGRLAVVCGVLPAADAASDYFARAKRLSPRDPQTWYASGVEARDRSDQKQMTADFARAAELSPTHQERVLKLLATPDNADALLSAFVPRDPVRLTQALAVLYPEAGTPGRQRTLDLILAETEARGDSAVADDRLSAALAAAELGLAERADAHFRAALDLAPNRLDVRDRYAAWLDGEERYAEAVEQLELIRARQANAHAARYDRARRGAELIRQIQSP